MAENTNFSSGYYKLTQTCKYLYPKNRIFVVNRIRFFGNGLYMLINGENTERYTISTIPPPLPFKITSKFLFDHVNLGYDSINLATEIMRDKTFRINTLNIQFLDVPFAQIFRPETAQTVKNIYLHEIRPQYADGSPMPLEKILEFFPNLEEFELKVS